jgi:hypothetical protein
MSNEYRATVNVMIPLPITTKEAVTHYAADVYAAMVGKIDAHMILSALRSSWRQVAPGVVTMTFVYQAGQDTEAAAIIHDAARVSGASYDAVTVRTRGRRLDVPALLAALTQTRKASTV